LIAKPILGFCAHHFDDQGYIFPELGRLRICVALRAAKDQIWFPELSGGDFHWQWRGQNTAQFSGPHKIMKGELEIENDTLMKFIRHGEHLDAAVIKLNQATTGMVEVFFLGPNLSLASFQRGRGHSRTPVNRSGIVAASQTIFGR
jgi:hypothetical protein